ncbi:formate/nitrite transporter family protein [Atopobacter phocae]|uniref:formate/nitrite transporter family protein n=1 Tax=Atopobacter phocae TaxID=136492 RepID=UPI0004719832|nr:formate/nitrite transporter family protein [Atopobacter phocae]
MNGLSSEELVQVTIKKGIHKVEISQRERMPLAFMGGLYIALGYLAYIRVNAILPEEWSSFGSFLGASVFPVGLILLLIAGGELLTGNMMAVGMAMAARKVSWIDLVKNWTVVALFNLIGAIFVAYFFGHVVGLTEGAYLAETLHVAHAKVDANFLQAFFSGIGCNILVGVAVFLSYGSKNYTDRALVTWFPVMTFVLIGFQHVVANFFVIPAAIFAGGDITWMDFLWNVIPVLLGNAVGGAVIIGALYQQVFDSSTVK